MGRRWSSLLVLVSLAACQFDPSGTGRNDGDDTGAVDGAPADASPPEIDASPTSPTSPIDAAETAGPVSCGTVTCASGTICCVDLTGSTCTTEQACGGATVSCDGPTDCPGQDCCMYAGLTTTCSSICIGGDQVCENASDCEGLTPQCCGSSLGPKVCRLLCL